MSPAFPLEGALARNHFIENAPKRKDVCPRVCFFPFQLLGSHVLHRAKDRARGGCVAAARFGRAIARRRLLREFCEAEIEKFRTARSDHDVAGLKVAMRYTLG